MNYTVTKVRTNNRNQSFSTFPGINQMVKNNLLMTIVVTIAGSLFLTGTSALNIWSIYNGFQSTITKQFALQKSSSEIIYTDEYFTMSMNMLVQTGDPKWATRYKNLMPSADQSMKTLLKNVTPALRLEAKKTDIAADRLFAMEAQALKLVEQNQRQAALAVIESPEYQIQKKIFGDGNQTVLAKVAKSIDEELANYQQQLLLSIVFAATTLPILLTAWVLVLAAVREYIRDRQTAESLAVSRLELVTLNQQLAEEVDLRVQQEQQIRAESVLLQHDVSHILDVVCAVEVGNLTIQANVNDRLTGLVADNLNRLITSLDRIIFAVVNTAKTVTTEAGQLEQVAMTTVVQAQSQVEQMRSIKLLMARINTLTSDSRQQATSTTRMVQQAKSELIAGNQAISDITTGIYTLEQGTDEIVKRSQLLTEFVDLAAQFSKDQKRVAALTQILALNVSTLASRAIGEQNPQQFASLAKEFEVIARQVNDLASDTNHSLISLQQRTDRVQTVTSGLTQDIADIDRLVQKFTYDVDRSRQAFDNIQNVTELISQMSKKVNVSNQDIVRTVNDALISIESISTVSQSTTDQAMITQDRVQSMRDLADKLLIMVEFFQLSESRSLHLASTQSY